MFQSGSRSLIFLLGLLTSSLGAQADLAKAQVLFEGKRYPEAQSLADQVVKADPRDAEAWYLLARIQRVNGTMKQAVAYAEKAIQLDPGQARYHLLRGRALGNIAQNANMFKAMTMAGDVRGSFEKAVQLEPSNRDAFLSLFDYYLNVPSIAGGGLDKAQALAERTLPLDASRGHYMKGVVLQRQKNPGAAQAEYRQSLAADPTFSVVYNLLGYVELEMNQVDLALEHFQKQVALDPTNPNSYDSLGDGLMAKGRTDDAIMSYRKALSVDPDFYASMRSLGKALEKAGKRDEAIQHYQRCAELGRQKGIPQMVKEAHARLKALGVQD